MIVRGPGLGAPHCVVVLHGMGASGADLAPLASQLWKGGDDVRWIFPDAALRAVSINGGMRMRAWYDVVTPRLLDKEDEPSILSSAAAVDALLDKQFQAGTDPACTILAGFSQGGALALHVGLRRKAALAAVVSMSGYLPLASTAAREATSAGRSTPLFIAAGSEDPVVSPIDTAAGAVALARLGCVVTHRVYPMGHSISEQELDDVRAFLDETCGLRHARC